MTVKHSGQNENDVTPASLSRPVAGASSSRHSATILPSVVQYRRVNSRAGGILNWIHFYGVLSLQIDMPEKSMISHKLQYLIGYL